MRRKTFDGLLTSVGAILTLTLVAAGGLLMWGAQFTSNEVHSQLAQQKITFPAKNSPEITAPEFAAMKQYAGQQMTTGAQAEVYADHFIANHLKAIGLTYSQASTLVRAHPTSTKDAALEQSVFQGTTLRSELLEAYGFSVLGTIAFVASIVAFGLAAVMAVLSVMGFAHLRRVSPTQQI
ncbi:MAG TPA: hypothetical protein VNN74_00555 [Candidatus Micrarchaeia archaeon]|nr:hypothetical protein [Candidatus Micrarchaeia archaeon]